MKVDPGFEETEKLLRKTEKEVAKVYKEARDEVQAKLDDYLRRFEIKDKTWRGWVKSGYKTQEEYNQWRIGQIAIGRRWEQMRDNLAEDLHNANDIARSIVQGHLPEVYAINHDYAAYDVENGLKMDTSYTLYDRQTVERLFGDDEIIPKPGKQVSEAIAAGKDIAWNNKQVQGAMLQGILQGETIPALAYRVAAVTADSNHKAAIRNARTMFTGVQNVGRIDSYKRAENMGIEMEQTWMATLDSRTRHAHRELDGVSVPVGEYFENELGKIRYPGDPTADPANIYNCRCTLRANLKGFEWNARNLSQRNTRRFDYDSYDKWREDRLSTSNPIDLPEKLSEQERQFYINEYRFGGRTSSKDEGKTVYSSSKNGKIEGEEEKHTDFFGNEKGINLESQYSEWIGDSKREEYLNAGDNPLYKNAINQLYKDGAYIGDGGTADAIRFEAETGISVGKNPDMNHLQKGQDMVNHIIKKVLNADLSDKEREIITKVRDDLTESIKEAKKK